MMARVFTHVGIWYRRRWYQQLLHNALPSSSILVGTEQQQLSSLIKLNQISAQSVVQKSYNDQNVYLSVLSPMVSRQKLLK